MYSALRKSCLWRKQLSTQIFVKILIKWYCILKFVEKHKNKLYFIWQNKEGYIIDQMKQVGEPLSCILGAYNVLWIMCAFSPEMEFIFERNENCL